MLRGILLILIALFFHKGIFCQQCNEIGQIPSTAFPVCGKTIVHKNTLPNCENFPVPTRCDPTNPLSDKNPFWYKITCYETGTLGFIIKPSSMGEGYKWQLFDITGNNAFEVYNNPALVISYNWSGAPTITGTRAGANTGLFVCNDPGYPTLNDMPTIIKGHEYLLLVTNHFQGTNGYELSFTGGTAVITDPVLPKLISAASNCDGTIITVNLNKKILCSSIAPDGSDFILPGASIASVINQGCLSGFDVDQIKLKLSSPLKPGSYSLTAKTGADGNTLLDPCQVSIPAGSKLNLSVSPLQPPIIDSLTPPEKCKPYFFLVKFNNDIKCSSIATDGSDFSITGPSIVNVFAATGICDNSGLASSILVQLANTPIQVGGTYQIKVKQGTDGNTLIDECNQLAIPSSQSFIVFDTVETNFSYQVTPGCRSDTIRFSGPSKGVTQWSWWLGDNKFSTQQNPTKVFAASGQYPIKLVVSNGACTDSSSKIIVLDDEVRAAFEVNNIMCPEDTAVFKNTSTGKITSWLWNFGNGVTSTQQTPPLQTYAKTGIETSYTALLTVFGNKGCVDTTSQKIRVLKSCFIGIPNAFSPNDDGLNDFFYPMNAFKADNLDFKVYNRMGQCVFKSNDWTKKWNGKIKGIQQPAGIYVWEMKYTHHDTRKKYSLKGTVTLIR